MKNGFRDVLWCAQTTAESAMAATAADDDDDQAETLEKFYECQEISDWMLLNDEPARVHVAATRVATSTDPPPDIISSFTADTQSRFILPVSADDSGFDDTACNVEVPWAYSSKLIARIISLGSSLLGATTSAI